MFLAMQRAPSDHYAPSFAMRPVIFRRYHSFREVMTFFGSLAYAASIVLKTALEAMVFFSRRKNSASNKQTPNENQYEILCKQINFWSVCAFLTM